MKGQDKNVPTDRLPTIPATMSADSLERDVLVCAFAAVVLVICWAMAVVVP